MPPEKLPGGPTQDEIMAVSLHKLGLRSNDTVLEIGCGTGKVTVAIAREAQKVIAIDARSEAIEVAKKAAKKAVIHNIIFAHSDAATFLESAGEFDCCFVGGTRNLPAILPVLAGKVKRTIVINAVLLSTVSSTVAALKELGLFVEVVQVQVSRSYELAGSIMFKPIDPVWIIVGKGSACS